MKTDAVQGGCHGAFAPKVAALTHVGDGRDAPARLGHYRYFAPTGAIPTNSLAPRLVVSRASSSQLTAHRASPSKRDDRNRHRRHKKQPLASPPLYRVPVSLCTGLSRAATAVRSRATRGDGAPRHHRHKYRPQHWHREGGGVHRRRPHDARGGSAVALKAAELLPTENVEPASATRTGAQGGRAASDSQRRTCVGHRHWHNVMTPKYLSMGSCMWGQHEWQPRLPIMGVAIPVMHATSSNHAAHNTLAWAGWAPQIESTVSATSHQCWDGSGGGRWSNRTMRSRCTGVGAIVGIYSSCEQCGQPPPPPLPPASSHHLSYHRGSRVLCHSTMSGVSASVASGRDAGVSAMPRCALRTKAKAVRCARVGQVQGVADRPDTFAIPPHAPPDANDNPSPRPPRRHCSPAPPMSNTGPGHPTEITTNNACGCPLTHSIEKMQLRRFVEPLLFCGLCGGTKNGRNCSFVHRGKLKVLRI